MTRTEIERYQRESIIRASMKPIAKHSMQTTNQKRAAA
ncbi:hypothetical protein VC894_16880 [Citrobacter freundii]|nr:hypothetical protein [Citrobacter freundii]